MLRGVGAPSPALPAHAKRGGRVSLSSCLTSLPLLVTLCEARAGTEGSSIGSAAVFESVPRPRGWLLTLPPFRLWQSTSALYLWF